MPRVDAEQALLVMRWHFEVIRNLEQTKPAAVVLLAKIHRPMQMLLSLCLVEEQN